MPIQIRKATLSDLEVLDAFQQKLIAHERTVEPVIKQEEPFRYYNIRALLDGSRQAIVMIAEADGIPVGSGFGEIRQNDHFFSDPLQGYIGLIYVDEAYRGHHISALIMDEIVQWFHKAGVHHIRLKVYANNTSALKAYEKYGFTHLLHEMKLKEK